MDTIRLLGTTLGLGFTAGLNLYATVLVTGVLIRFGWLAVPPHLQGLDVLANPVVLFVAGFMYAVEFLADKIPVVDHVWDFFHTLIRPLGAALIAWHVAAGAGIPEPLELAVILAAGGAAFSTHAAKAGSRIGIASVGGHGVGAGLAASVGEDVVALSLAPLAIAYPTVTLVIVVVALSVIGVLAPRVLRLLGTVRRTLWWTLRHAMSDRTAVPLPERVADRMADVPELREDFLAVPAFAVRAHGVPRWMSGYLAIAHGHAIFVGTGWLKTRVVPFNMAEWATTLGGSRWRTKVTLLRKPDRMVLKCYPLTTQMHSDLVNRFGVPPIGNETHQTHAPAPARAH